jgi:hypothetical protein
MSEHDFHGKGEEIPVIAGIIYSSLSRDWVDFQTSFPKIFTNNYLSELEEAIKKANSLLNPHVETVEMKNTTNQLYASMDSLKEASERVSGYLKFTKGVIPISPKDFGLTPLLQKIRSRDAEGVLKNLRNVIDNLQRYHQPLTEQGLTEDIINIFTQALAPIEENNRKQVEILSKRKIIVAENKNTVYDLYKTVMEICQIGKMLYKGKDALKTQDYTYSQLLKKVRVVKKKE